MSTETETKQYILYGLRCSWSEYVSYYFEDNVFQYTWAYEEVYKGNPPTKFFLAQLRDFWIPKT